MSGRPALTSAPPPPPAPDDHLTGEAGPLIVEYADYECPYCARAEILLAPLRVRRLFRHFPVASKHPRARALSAAAEAAGLQGRFWEMHESLLRDQGRVDDPHLWDRARHLGLDIDRFERDRRSEQVAERVERDFRSGLRAGVTTTPTFFLEGAAYSGPATEALVERLAAAGLGPAGGRRSSSATS